jgi:hypothetical protein
MSVRACRSVAHTSDPVAQTSAPRYEGGLAMHNIDANIDKINVARYDPKRWRIREHSAG